MGARAEDALSETQRTELLALLERKLAEVEGSHAAAMVEARPVDLDLPIGRLSRMDALQQQQMALARRQRVEVNLQQLRSALARMRSGGYGECVRCGESIGFARLKARPEVTLCHECQTRGGG